MTSPIRKVLRVALYGVVPAAALLVGSPVGLSIWEGGNPSPALILLVSPFYLGLLGAPGYLFVAYAAPSSSSMGPGRRWWVRASLLLALVASLGGMWGGTQVFFLLPPSLISAVAVVLLWREFERAPRQPLREGPVPVGPE
jgi:hypothetical protein